MNLDTTALAANNESAPEKIESDRILTLTEVAALLRMHKSTVCRHAKSGALVSYKIGSRRLIKESDAWAFFEKHIAR